MFVRNKQQLVVDCYPPARVRLLWIAIFSLLAGLAWAIWIYAPGLVDAELAATGQQRLKLMGRFSHSESERKRLGSEVERLETMQQVDQDAYALLQQNFNSLQDEIVGLKEQLAFYQAVVAPDQGKPGVKIDRFSVRPADDGGYDYSLVLVLVQAPKNQAKAKGKFSLTVQGFLDGRKKTLSMAQLTEPSVESARVRFRYFQNISGRLRFPAGFVPQRISLKVDMAYPHQDVKKGYSWDGILSE